MDKQALRRFGEQQALQSVARIAFVLGVIAVSVVSLIPTTALPGVPISDKVSHVLAYGALAITGGVGFERRTALLALGIFALGVTLECLQMLVPGRFTDVIDLIANAIGIALGLTLVRLSANFRR